MVIWVLLLMSEWTWKCSGYVFGHSTKLSLNWILMDVTANQFTDESLITICANVFSLSIHLVSLMYSTGISKNCCCWKQINSQQTQVIISRLMEQLYVYISHLLLSFHTNFKYIANNRRVEKNEQKNPKTDH